MRVEVAHHFRIETGRGEFTSRKSKPDERQLEQAVFKAFGPYAPQRDVSLWMQLVAYQVPLFNSPVKKDHWGWVDLLAVTSHLDPIVIELKHENANDTPFRTLVECVANMIAVETNWPRLRTEVETLSALHGYASRSTDRIVVPHGILLAPARYWQNWGHEGQFSHRVDDATRSEFRALRTDLRNAGYPTTLASVGLGNDSLPELQEVKCDW